MNIQDETYGNKRHKELVEKYSKLLNDEQQEKLGSIWMREVAGLSEKTAASFGFTGKLFAQICFYDFERFGIPTKKEEWSLFWEKSRKCHKEKLYLS